MRVHTNGLLRQCFPNGSNLRVHGPDDLRAVEDRLNNRPRRVLGWATSAEDLHASHDTMKSNCCDDRSNPPWNPPPLGSVSRVVDTSERSCHSVAPSGAVVQRRRRRREPWTTLQITRP